MRMKKAYCHLPGLLPVLIVLSTLIPLFLYPQGRLKEARKEMDLFNYSYAAGILQKEAAENNKKTLTESSLLLGECYFMLNDAGQACRWYAESLENPVTDPNAVPSTAWYRYARSLRTCGRYSEAKRIFLHCDSLQPGDRMVSLYAAWCDSALYCDQW